MHKIEKEKSEKIFPTLSIISDDRYKEKLKILNAEKEVIIYAYIDGVCNEWKIDKKILQGFLK